MKFKESLGRSGK